jgi:hypothetical protein
MQVDISSIETDILQAIGIVLAALISWAAQQIVAHLKLANAAKITAMLDDAADKGIQFGVMKSQAEIKSLGWDHVTVQSAVEAKAGQYLVDKFPAVLRQSGIDPTTAVGAAKISDLVIRSLPSGMAEAAASPTTPPSGPTSTVLQNQPPTR